MTQPFDLKTFIELQKQYASDLAGISISNPTTATNANSAINSLGTQLSSLDSALNASNADTNSLILQQNTINRILDTEDERLAAKRANIDNAINGQQRLIQLNDTYRKRYSAYIKLVFIIVLALVIIIALMFINKLFPLIPQSVYTLLYIIILSVSIIYAWFILSDIQKRDKFEYDKRTRLAPVSKDELQKNAEAAAKAGELLASVGPNAGCKSEGCCAPGTMWEKTLGKCVPGSSLSSILSGFTTIKQAYEEEKELHKTIQPYTPNEFESYSKL